MSKELILGLFFVILLLIIYVAVKSLVDRNIRSKALKRREELKQKIREHTKAIENREELSEQSLKEYENAKKSFKEWAMSNTNTKSDDDDGGTTYH